MVIPSTQAKFEEFGVDRDPSAAGGKAAKATWAVVRVVADWDDVDSAVSIGEGEAETVVVQEFSAPANTVRGAAGSPLLRRSFELLSVAGERGMLVIEGEPISPAPEKGGTHRVTVRARVESAAGEDRPRAATFVVAAGERLAALAGIETTPAR